MMKNDLKTKSMKQLRPINGAKSLQRENSTFGKAHRAKLYSNDAMSQPGPGYYHSIMGTIEDKSDPLFLGKIKAPKLMVRQTLEENS